VKYDEYRAGKKPKQRRRARDPAVQTDARKWIFSEPLPKPWAAISGEGVLDDTQNPKNRANGWSRLVGKDEDYKYLPDQDLP